MLQDYERSLGNGSTNSTTTTTSTPVVTSGNAAQTTTTPSSFLASQPSATAPNAANAIGNPAALAQMMAQMSTMFSNNNSNNSGGNAETRYADQLNRLQEMGFPNRQANLRALIETFGDLDAAVERLLTSRF